MKGARTRHIVPAARPCMQIKGPASGFDHRSKGLLRPEPAGERPFNKIVHPAVGVRHRLFATD